MIMSIMSIMSIINPHIVSKIRVSYTFLVISPLFPFLTQGIPPHSFLHLPGFPNQKKPSPSNCSAPFSRYSSLDLRLSLISDTLVRPLQFGMQLGIQEIVIGIPPTKWMFPQERCSSRSFTRIHRKAVKHKCHGLSTDTTAYIVRNGWGLVQRPQFKDRADGFFLRPRAATGEHFEHDAAKRPDVDFGGVTLTLGADNFGGHPEDRALHAVCDVVAIDIIRLLGDAEVGDLASAVDVE